MKIKILLFGCLCLLISGAVDAKQKKSKTQKTETSEQTQQEQNKQLQKEKPKMCYTHTKKWHPCPVQPKNEKEQTQ